MKNFIKLLFLALLTAILFMACSNSSSGSDDSDTALGSGWSRVVLYYNSVGVAGPKSNTDLYTSRSEAEAALSGSLQTHELNWTTYQLTVDGITKISSLDVYELTDGSWVKNDTESDVNVPLET